MSTDYTYDEQGQFFPYFVITLASLVTLPVTYSFLSPSKELESTAARIRTTYKLDDAALIDGQRRKQKRRERKSKRMIVALVGWMLIAWMVYLMIVTTRTIPKLWDPYDVLGVSRSASEKQIKSHYRRLSLSQHPDKATVDVSKNETAEFINDRWVDVTKAFKALTDEEIRNNFLQYGHPDGKQSYSIGIALPSFIVTEGNGKYVLLLYGILLGVLLPYLVGKWWYGTQRMTKERVLVASAGNLFREYDDGATEGDIIGILSSGEEFHEALGSGNIEESIERIEEKILVDGVNHTTVAGLTAKDRRKMKDMELGTRRKALDLLWAYVGRVDLGSQALNDEKYEVAPLAQRLNESFIAIALAYGNTIPAVLAYRTSQNLLQALYPKAPPLLQLPYFTLDVVRAVEGDLLRTHLTVQDYMRTPESHRRAKVVKPGLLTSSQFSAAMEVAAQMPYLQVEKAFFKVIGERVITPSSLVNFVIKARFVPPGSRDVPAASESDLQDVDPVDRDLNALHERKRVFRTANAKQAEQKGSGDSGIQAPLAHAPYFARDHAPRWLVFLTDSKQGKISVPPFTFTTFDKPIFDDRGKPTLNIQTLKMQFQAPPQVGRYTFVMHLVCDSYVGMDTKTDVTLVIDDMSKADDIDADEDISEPDEDTLAGQMHALKSGGLTGAVKAVNARPARKEESSDDSDTEGDEASDSETDTDTDTDGE